MSSLRKNSIYGLIGFVIPTLVILVAYPVLVRQLGNEAFGIYILASSISGSVAFLDFGFSAATLKFIAEDMARNDRKSVSDMIVASLLFYGGMGLFLSLFIWVSSSWLVSLFSIHTDLIEQSIFVFRLSAIQLVVFFMTTVFISLFKGMHRFDLSTSILSILSMLTYGGAVAGVLLFDVKLIGVSVISLCANLIVFLISIVIGYALCLSHDISFKIARPQVTVFKRMFNFGSAMTISSIASILHAQLQRILIGSTIGPQYVTSFFIGVWGPAKVNSATLALSEPLFPKISSLSNDVVKCKSLYRKYVFIIAFITFVTLFPLFLFSNEIYALWFGQNIPPYAPAIASIMAGALFLNSISQPAHHLINGIGKPWINTLFTIISPVILYSTLLVLFVIHRNLDILDFAWATAFSLGITSVLYFLWIEFKLANFKIFSLNRKATHE